MDINRTAEIDPNTVFRVGFLLTDAFPLMAYAAAVEPLRAANKIAGRLLYKIENITAASSIVHSAGDVVIKADTYVGERVDFDLIVVMAAESAMQYDDKRALQWLRLLDRRGVMLCGISGGAVILARAGVMDGRRMTTFWDYSPTLMETMPHLLLERAHYITDRNRMTCAGGIAALDMMHSLIAQQQGAPFARKVSDWFVHTEVRSSEGPQRSSLGERYGTTHLTLIRAIEAMEAHISEPLTLENLAALAGLGSRQLNRLFQDKMGRSTMAFYRDIRLDRAKNLVEHASMKLTDIALATGFASSSHFSRCFHERYNMPPKALRR